MASNFKDTKIALETQFKNLWTDTVIQYSGVPLDSDDYAKWINIIYEPSAGMVTGLGTVPNMSRGMFYVVCWAEDEFDAQELGDSVASFFFANPIDDLVYSDYQVIDSGYNPNNNAFLVLAFPIKSYLQCN